MMKIRNSEMDAWLGELAARGIRLELRGGSILVRGASKLTDAERAALRVHRDLALDLLAASPADPNNGALDHQSGSAISSADNALTSPAWEAGQQSGQQATGDAGRRRTIHATWGSDSRRRQPEPQPSDAWLLLERTVYGPQRWRTRLDRGPGAVVELHERNLAAAGLER